MLNLFCCRGGSCDLGQSLLINKLDAFPPSRCVSMRGVNDTLILFALVSAPDKWKNNIGVMTEGGRRRKNCYLLASDEVIIIKGN